MSDCSLRSRGSRLEAAAFLSHSQTKSMAARSLVQDSGSAIPARVESAYFVVACRGKNGSRCVSLLAPLADAGAAGASLAQQCQIARSAREDRAWKPPTSTAERDFPTLAATASPLKLPPYGGVGQGSEPGTTLLGDLGIVQRLQGSLVVVVDHRFHCIARARFGNHLL